MTTHLSPYLHFEGTARAAMEFYHSVLGGDLQLTTFADMGLAERDAEHAARIMHGMLTVHPGLVLLGSDGPPDQAFPPGNYCTLSLTGGDAEKLRRWFTGLMEGGQVNVPLARQMWGDEFGQGVDRFGIPWLVNIAAGADAPASGGA